jgi:hypothetical protein
MKRKRRHIPLSQRYAAALSLLLPQAERDALRERKATAQEVIRLFTPDHVVLHCQDGSDAWHNLTITRRGPALKAKDARDTRIAAKVKRIETRWNEFTRTVLAIKKRPRKKSRWPKARFG